MSELLPSDSDVPADQAGELRTLWLDSEEAGDLLSSLASETARGILTSLHEEPATASEVADRAETSLQNARHHLESLEESGLVRVADTRYSEKGREMNVYAPAEDPMVVFVGRRDEPAGFTESLKQLLPVAGVVAVGSVLAQYLLAISTGGGVEGGLPRLGDSAGAAGSAPLGLAPGLVFLAGGLAAMVAAAYWLR